MRFAIVPVVALSLLATSSPAFAQHERMPGTAPPSASAGACAQNSRAVTQALDEVNARVEEARQLNDPARLRAAVGDLQLALTQMKAQLADCVGLGADAGGAMGNMPGMDHSKMAMGNTAPASGAGAANSQGSNGVVVLLRTEPAPPRNGKNDFEVTVKDAAGKPITDADVSLTLVMTAMAGMESTVKLASVGNGAYKGSGTIAMSGDWDVTVTATRKGQPLVSKMMRLSAK